MWTIFSRGFINIWCSEYLEARQCVSVYILYILGSGRFDSIQSKSFVYKPIICRVVPLEYIWGQNQNHQTAKAFS